MDNDNLTSYGLGNSPLHQGIMLILFIPLICLIVFGNTLVIVAACRESRLRTPGYIILTSLAITDLLTGLIATPSTLFSRVIKSDVTCNRATSGYLTVWNYVFCSVSIVHLCLITADRYIAITRPLRYITMVTTTRVLFIIAIAWAAGVTYGILSVIESVAREDNMLTQLCTGVGYTDYSTRSFLVATGLSIIFYAAFLIVLNIRILNIAMGHMRRIRHDVIAHGHRTGRRPAAAKANVNIRQVKGTKTVFLVVGAFCISWFPTAIWMLTRTFINISHVSQIIFFEITFFTSNANSAMNPVIYCFKDRLFRQTFFKIFPPLEKLLAANKPHVNFDKDIAIKRGQCVAPLKRMSRLQQDEPEMD